MSVARDESERSKKSYRPHKSGLEPRPTRAQRDSSDRDGRQRAPFKNGTLVGMIAFFIALLVGILFMLQH